MYAPHLCPVHLAGTQPVPIQCGFRPHKGGRHAGMNDAGEVVWFPADPVVEVAKEWRVIWDYGQCSCSNEQEADGHVENYRRKERYKGLRKQFRTVPVFISVPWQDA